jgi:broad specificity phosphatase PhoE
MILLRHGQSEFNLHYNATGIDPGIPDAPLTPLGRQQAETAAAELASEDIRRIVCSPYTRALQTATPVATRLGLPVEVTPSVRERFGASCDVGTPREHLLRAWPHLDLAALDEIWWPAEDEPHHEVEARAASFRRELALRPDWAHTLVVCHWGFILAMTGRSLTNCEWMRWSALDDTLDGPS